MKAILKIAFLASLVAGLSTFQFIYANAVQPELAGEIALEQFANPSTEVDAASRLLSNSKIFNWCWLAILLTGLALFWSPTRVLVNRYLSDEDRIFTTEEKEK